jgi:hypothetical protein
MLADYLEGRLASDERSEMDEHLSGCSICLEELIVASKLFTHRPELDPASAEVTEAAVALVQDYYTSSIDYWSERVKQSVKDLRAKVSGFFEVRAWPEMRLQPIRSSQRLVAKDLIQLRKDFGGIATAIEIEKVGQNRAQIKIKLMDHEKIDRVVRVTLNRGEREVSSTLVNGGVVLFEDIPFGQYSLTLSDDGHTFGTYSFEIKEAGNGRR